jgi:hypothetical protein
MATNQEIIDKALQEIFVLVSGASASADESSDMLDMLNGMMAEWAVQDKDLNFPPQDTLGDTCPIPDWAEIGVITNLALEAAPSFDGQITPALVQKADRSRNTIETTLINLKLEGADMSHLPVGTGVSGFSILTDN